MEDETMAAITSLEARVRQLERDLEFALQSIALLNTRYAAMDDRERLREARQMRGVR